MRKEAIQTAATCIRFLDWLNAQPVVFYFAVKQNCGCFGLVKVIAKTEHEVIAAMTKAYGNKWINYFYEKEIDFSKFPVGIIATINTITDDTGA